VDTGELLRSIRVIETMGGTRFHVVATAKHARFVEFGSMHGGTWIAPNPFLRKALADAKREFPSIMQAARLRAPGESGPPAHLGVSLGG